MRSSSIASRLSTLCLLLSGLCASAADIDVVRDRRLSIIVGGTTGATSISNWVSTLGADGKWPDVDYTTGCDAQRSSWPAQTHWSRINTFAAGWHGGFRNADQWVKNADVRTAISRAMNFWFANDFTDAACLDFGGQSACPCGTAGLWNTNWFSNVILIPGWVGQVCTLLGDSLSTTELQGCIRMTNRAFNTFSSGINGVSSITGANTLDIASIGVDLSLFTGNATLLSQAFNKIDAEVMIQNDVKADGIRADGSFGQHQGILYNGNYGKDYANDVLALEIATGGTQFEATADSMNAFSTLLDGNQWMIYKNTVTNVLHWDFSVLGRIIALPVSDNQATANLKTNLTQLQVLGQVWESQAITSVFNRLNSASSTANVGSLNGNRMFYANDYMVHRGSGYVTTLKMYSKRTQNTECTNSQNPFGFHLSDGTLYTYLQGNEYEDITAAWDWNLIPGTTVDYGATPLTCSTARKTGTQPLVGGATDGTVGVAAMRYETPTTKTLNWRKTWFFLEDDVQFVMVARIESTTTAPVFSILDQKRRSGDVLVDGVSRGSGNYTGVGTLWHAGVGYVFNTSTPSVSLSLQLGSRTGAWSSISASKAPPATVDLFAAWLNHGDLSVPISYTIYPSTSTSSAFRQKAAATQLRSVRNDGSISALLDVNHRTAMIVYWVAAGGSVSIPSPTGNAPITVASNGNANLILHMDTWSVTLSDPTQTLSTVTVTFSLGSGTTPAGWGTAKTKSVNFSLPIGGQAGKSVTQTLPN
ncbi:polysaccharide lyase family 8 protein [Pleurotus eryngii]|uniref:Polysaccharide lyase family 8 protein n=1 Tax=Pleurotus eryngii TaxID=5323 RepID=A0A9P6A645_PLEER|nr:polysaccharide lyase family 8 protein [Pleurotus eryngii]